ncbi:LysR substrate-binding domain-containing protein [Vibrio sonorensis]|uniref:LysR substrate-binding domain-containing protein n=1 Tax=Vibrio sonorensis TaxID=1004316 RepID=UPI0008DA46BE|nr:LysR substrate-binding domain-containing protein [Vibrio sonorensis]
MDKRLRHLSGLRYFEAAARLKSYSKAAEELFVSQAAVSQKIRQLEEELDCKLFVRKGREMTATQKGHTLYEQVSRGFEHILTGLNQIQSEPLEGLLKVSVPPSFASRWLVPRLWKFTLQYPNIPIRIVTSCENPDIRHGAVDVAIWQGEKMECENNLDKELLLEEKIYPFCSPELAKSVQFTSPEQLLKCWLIDYDSGCYPWQSWFEIAGVNMERSKVQWMEVGTFDMAISAVMAGHGACLASDCLASDFIERGMLTKPFDIGMTPGIRFNLFTAQDSPRRERIRAFTSWLKEEVGLKADQVV